ncbi:MAG: 5-oxoprolinase subunit PxpA [Woeseiaceae bacterium]
MTTIDLNADLGEGDAFDVELMRVISSCNIACGGHAGNTGSMAVTVDLATANDVVIGAHPSYPDRAGFGRTADFCAGEELHNSLLEQIDTISRISQDAGQEIRHIKPHGALYNDAAQDAALAEIVVRAAQKTCPSAAIVGPPHGALRVATMQAGINYIAEGFVDRAYAADGTLVPRTEPNAVHSDINTITTQALRLTTAGEVTAENGEVIAVPAQTLCLHGDTPIAGEVGRAVRDVLLKSGVDIRALA